MKNKLTDLHNHLFMQLERLGDESLKPEELQTEIDRSKAMAGVAKNIVEVAKVSIDAIKILDEFSTTKLENTDVVRLFIGNKTNE